jgi:hypothetical protein
MFNVLMIYLFVFACFQLLPLGTDDFENLQELDFQYFGQQPVGEQGKRPLTILSHYAFSL